MREFQKAIKKIKCRSNLTIIAEFLFKILTVVLVVFSLFQFIYLISVNQVTELFFLSLGLKLLSILIAIYLIVKANSLLMNDLRAAEFLDNRNRDKTDTYQNAIELIKEQQINRKILEKILTRADILAFNQNTQPNRSRFKNALIVTILVIFAHLILFVFANQSYQDSLKFYSLSSLPPVEHKDYVEVSPGDLAVVKQTDVFIKVIEPEPEVEHRFFYKRDASWREEKLVSHQKKFSNLDFSFSYFVRTPYAVSDTFRIDVYELPAVKQIKIHYDYPNYTGLKTEIDDTGNGNIKAIRNTEVTLFVEANNPIVNADLIFSSGKIISMQREGKASFKANFRITENGTYHINLVDFLKNKSRKIIRTISVIPDREPEIEIVYPGKDTLLNQNMLLPLRIQAVDDFGLQDLNLKYYVNDEAEDSLAISDRIKGAVVELDYEFDLRNTFLIPGDRVTYWAEVTDNSPELKTASSKRYVVRFPSIEEIYQEIEREEKTNSDLMQNTLEKSLELQEEFEEKRRELLRKDDLNWEDKKQLEDFLERQENLNQEIEQVADSYQDLLDKFENNQALSQETLQKMEKIKELMDQIATEDLKDAMEELRKSLENVDPDVLRKAMEDFQFSLEDFSRKLDQTIDLLQQIKKEQAMQKALEISEEMEEMQDKLNQRTEDESASGEDLAKEQDSIAEKYEALKDQLENTKDLLTEEKDQEVREKMEELQQEMENDGLNSDLEQSSQDLQQNNFQKAQQSQCNASSKMKNYTNKLSQMQQMMSSGFMSDVGEIIDLTIRRLLIFSKEHELSMKNFSGDPYLILPHQIANFEGINLSLQKLYNVPMIALILGPKFIYDANFTTSSYRELFQNIDEAGRHRLSNYLKDIQKGINLMIFDLMQAGKNMQGGGGGMQSLMQAMQQMGQQQMLINMATQQLFQQMGEDGRLSRDMLAEARRLARDEERLAENLKRILQNDPEAQKQTSALNQIIEDLESISRNLKMGRLDQDMIDQQERILSRLLDAQKSIHKREFSKKRKAEISDIEYWDLPEEIKLRFEEMRQKALLEDEYKKYPKEYQELIQEYLRLLNQKADRQKK